MKSKFITLNPVFDFDQLPQRSAWRDLWDKAVDKAFLGAQESWLIFRDHGHARKRIHTNEYKVRQKCQEACTDEQGDDGVQPQVLRDLADIIYQSSLINHGDWEKCPKTGGK